MDKDEGECCRGCLATSSDKEARFAIEERSAGGVGWSIVY